MPLRDLSVFEPLTDIRVPARLYADEELLNTLLSDNSAPEHRDVARRASASRGAACGRRSRQTNRPSLWAIIGLKSMPAMQYGQRMVKIVSFIVGIGRSCTRAIQKSTQDSRRQGPVIPQKAKGALGATRVSNRSQRRDFGRRADRRAVQAGDRDAQPSSASGEKRKRPRLG